MRVLWTHNFDPGIQNSGVFVHTMARGVRAHGVDLHTEYLGNLRSAAQLLRARRRIREIAEGFDVIHAQYGSACAMVTAAVESIPKVLTIRGSDWHQLSSPRSLPGVHSRLACKATRASVGRFDFVLPVSRRIAGELRQLTPDTELEVLPSPIDLTRFRPLDKHEVRRCLGYAGNDEKWVLFNTAERGNPVKRFDLAKQAFELARARLGALRLQVVTGIPHEEVPLITAACDVAICTSESEGWPNSVKEALACNVPFVATDVSDLRDIANAESSCRVCPADARVLADSICEVVTSPEPRDLRRHVADMDLDAVSSRLVSIYRSVISRFAR